MNGLVGGLGLAPPRTPLKSDPGSSRGGGIDRPHRCHCLCDDCQTLANQDELKFARSRLNAYRALASEAYLSLLYTFAHLSNHTTRRLS